MVCLFFLKCWLHYKEMIQVSVVTKMGQPSVQTIRLEYSGTANFAPSTSGTGASPPGPTLTVVSTLSPPGSPPQLDQHANVPHVMPLLPESAVASQLPCASIEAP